MAIKASSAASSGWDRDARKAGRSKRRDLSGWVSRGGVRARIVPHRGSREGSRRESEGEQTPGEGRQGRKIDVGSRDEAMTAPLMQIAKQGAEARDLSRVEGSV